MKRLIAVLTIAMLCLGVAQAAEWEDGTSAAQPYPGVPAANLEKQMGYMLTWPQKGAEGEKYCDTLHIYLPREDVALGSGVLRLMGEAGEVCAVGFDDASRVRLSPLDEATLQGLNWGGGVGIEVRLPVSLALGEGQWITMDEGCYTAANGKVVNGQVGEDDSWRPVVKGDFGVGSLRFTTASGEITAAPKAGDLVCFDVTLGGDAAFAVLESADGSVTCDAGGTFEESGAVTLRLTDADFAWTLYFMNEAGEIVDYLDFDNDMAG